MTMARSKLVDPKVTRYYHCISRCVRQAFLCGKDFEHRKQWIEDRLELLAGCFALSVCGFSVMDNHLHVLVRLDPNDLTQWSDEDVIRNWIKVYPPKTPKGEEVEINKAWIDDQLLDENKVAIMRERLGSLGWFMKALKEPLARMANQEDECRGAFWEGRYKSIAILDEEALLTTCAYVDLNPVAAGIATAPETSTHTSVRQRVRHVRSKGRMEDLKAATCSASVASSIADDLELDHWLCPLEDRSRHGADREGMLESFSLGSYLLLVDYTSRLCRLGKARISSEVASLLDRLGSSEEIWRQRIERLFAAGSRLSGSFFAGSKERLREVAARRRVHHIDNLAACKAV